MFSVIIPLYNKAGYIEKAIRSVQTQTYRQFELIVVDDGSTDDPLPPKGGSVAVRLKDFDTINDKIRIVEQQNQGVSTARNNGVKLAKYDYIAFLDADDWWEPTYLEEMKKLIDEYPEAGIYSSGYYLIKNGQKRKANIGVEAIFEKGIINYFQVYAKTLIMPVWTGATVIKKSIFEENRGFKATLKLGEDFDLWVRVALKYPLAFLNKPLANYNQDVEQNGRAIGKIHNPENHVLWNLDYLADEEKSNIDLKLLLDKLRVYIMKDYIQDSKYKPKAKRELEKVDWRYQPLNEKMWFHLPAAIQKMIKIILLFGSGFKQRLIRIIQSFQ